MTSNGHGPDSNGKTPRDMLVADMAEDLPELTDQQFSFVQGLLSGLTATDAYRRSYDCTNSKPTTVFAAASRLRANTKVAAWLKAARIAHLGAGLVTKDNHLRELERLRELALDAGKISAAVVAEISRGKAAGLYVEQYADVTDDPVSALNNIAEIAPEVAERLAREAGIPWQATEPTPSTKH